MARGNDWKLNRLTVCWCSSSIAPRDRTRWPEPGGRPGIAYGTAWCTPLQKSPRVTAAGCAGTTAGVNRSGAPDSEPNHGERTRTPGSWSSAPDKSRPWSRPQGVAPMFAGQPLRAAKKSEINAIERFRTDGLDECDLISDLVELPRARLRREHKHGGNQRRLRDRVLQFLAKKRGCAGNCNLVHEIPFVTKF